MTRHTRHAHTRTGTRATSLAPLRGRVIGIIGAGTMGQALIKGLLAHGLSRGALRVADPSVKARRVVRRRFRLQAVGRSASVVRESDILILAVKPQQFPTLVRELAAQLTRRHLVISIAAGVSLRWLQARLPGIPMVRAMPNLPATVGCGFTAVAPGRLAVSRHRAIASALFGAVGAVAELPERYFHAVTAVSGSGPAYVFFLVSMWEEAARVLGLPPSVARSAIQRTLDGSVRLLQAAGEPAATLIGKVTSKRGTTEAALKVLAKRRVSAHFTEALQAAARRSHTLSR